MKIDIFPHLNEEEFSQLQKISHLKKFTKGDIIFYEGDIPEFLYYLIHGVVKVFKTNFSNGRDITLNYILPGCFVGEFAAIKEIPFPISAEMETDGEVLLIEKKPFFNMLKGNFKLEWEFMKLLASKIHKNYEYCENLVEKNAKKKILKFLRDHEDLFFTLNKNKIASILNVSPETLSRTLKELKEEGLIIERTVIKVNKQKIQEILEDMQ